MTSSQSSVHKTFKEIKIHTAKCDQCNKHNSDTIYRCEDCSEQCCTPCWNQLGEDGDHLLNHALTVIIPADEMPKRKPKARKLGGSTKKAAKKANVTKSEKQPEEQQKDIIDVDDPNDVEIEKGFTAINSAKKTSRTAQKETSTVQSFARPDDDHNPSNSDPKISSNLHSKQTSRSTAHAAKSALRAPSTPKAPYGRSTTWNRGNNIVFKAGDAVRDGMPDMPANSNATAEVENGVLRITNANKRKRSDTAQEDQDPPDDHQASHAHKKACTSSGHGSEASMGSSPTRHEEEEHAQTLLLLAQGAQQSSPVPSPPTSNARSEPLSSHTRSSSSSFDDLPVWPPKPIPQHKPDTTSTRNRTFPAGHQHYEMAGVRQAQAHGRALAALALAPREGMVNRVWYPEVSSLVVAPPSPFSYQDPKPSTYFNRMRSLTLLAHCLSISSPPFNLQELTPLPPRPPNPTPQPTSPTKPASTATTLHPSTSQTPKPPSRTQTTPTSTTTTKTSTTHQTSTPTKPFSSARRAKQLPITLINRLSVKEWL